MRKVLLRWKVSSLSGIDEIDKLMEICHRIEVLGHLSTDRGGVTQLVELGITKDGIYLKSRIWRVLMLLKRMKRMSAVC